MLALPAFLSYAKAPDSLPLPAVKQKNTAPQSQPAPGRGQMLYENHCMSCHTSVAHIRTRHSARSLAEVERWTGQLHLPWGTEEIDDVVRFLNVRYYHYAQP